MNTMLNWLEERTGFREILHEALYERIPGGARWRYVWGSTLVFTFAVQVITGFFLWAAYSPSAQTAWESVYYIQYVMEYGWLVRGLHHFTAQAMIVLLVLHLMQVVIDGAYRAPREVNFWLGLILMQIVLGLSLTGYLLPWDQKGYWATQVATSIMGITPGVGAELQTLATGGTNYGHHTLTRFFALHAGMLPALLVAFLALHIYVFRRHGITTPKIDRGPAAMFWPEQVLKDAVACLAVLAAVLFLVIWRGAPLDAPADPAEAYSAARPEWYFLFLFQFLKFFPGKGEVIGAIVIPGLIMLVLFLMPFVGRSTFGHRLNVVFLFALLGGVGYLTWLAIDEDNRDPKHQAAITEAEEHAHRIKELVQGPRGIGFAGAGVLLREDAFTQGPRIFAKNCSACHRFDGHDGTGHKVLELKDGKEVAAVPTATDLGKFGSREWMKHVIKDFAKHFQPTENGSFVGQKVGNRFTAGKMAEWSTDNAPKMTTEELDAVVEFLVAQGQRPDTSPAPDAKLVAAGKEFFELGNDEIAESCVSCHAMQPVGEAQPLEGGGNAPSLTGYASEAWLKSFLKNPAAKEHYGKKNAMPAFEGRLSEQDLQLLVDWMLHRWYEPRKPAKG